MFKKKTKEQQAQQQQQQQQQQPADLNSPAPQATPNYGGQPDVVGESDTAGNKAGMIDKFSTGRRRLRENIAQKTGKEAADNSEFEERWQPVIDLRDKMTKVHQTMRRQLNCVRALCLASADLGNACADANVRDVQFQNTQFQLDEEMRKRLDGDVVKAMESLSAKLLPFAELEKMVHSRNNLKLDYDHYVRKVRDLKEKPGADVAKLSNNEAKLTAARQRLQEATSKLYKAFGYYDAIGGKLCQPEIEMFKKAEQGFFGAASAAVNEMVARDPQEVAREVEILGKDGMNAPFTLPVSEYGSSHGGGGGLARGMSGAIKDASQASRDDSPDRSPSSAYVPSSSSPWLTDTTGNTGTAGTPAGGVGAASGGGYKSPAAAAGGSWWDKHTATAEAKAPPPPPASAQQRARALFTYAAADDTELSLTEGEVLTVVTQDQSGWWTGEKGGQKGLFPSNYVSLM